MAIGKLALLRAYVAQIFTKTPEEHVSEAWRNLDPTTHAVSPSIEPDKNANIISQETDSREIRVKLFPGSDFFSLTVNNYIYSTFLLEPCGGLSLERVRNKWGLYNCECVYRGRSGTFSVVNPRNPNLLSHLELQYLCDSEGAMRLIENPPMHIQRWREHRRVLLNELVFWRTAPYWSSYLFRLYDYFRFACRPIADMKRNARRASRAVKWTYISVVHLAPLLLAYWLWHHFSGMMLAAATCVYALVFFLSFVQCRGALCVYALHFFLSKFVRCRRGTR